MRDKVLLKLGLWSVVALPLIAVGCSSASGPARTVSYFQAHAEEREALYRRCADDPGSLGKSPECVNVEQAEAIEGIGSLRKLPPMQFPKVPQARAKGAAGVEDGSGAPSR